MKVTFSHVHETFCHPDELILQSLTIAHIFYICFVSFHDRSFLLYNFSYKLTCGYRSRLSIAETRLAIYRTNNVRKITIPVRLNTSAVVISDAVTSRGSLWSDRIYRSRWWAATSIPNASCPHLVRKPM